MKRWWLIVVLCAVGCKAYVAPQQVQSSLEHQLEDLVLIEAELLPFVPEDAEIPYKTITGETKTRKARELWQERLRAFMFRMAGALEWSRGKPYDEKAAFAKLFPNKLAPVPADGDGQ